MMGDGIPFDLPLTDVDAASVAMHEMFLAHLGAGFTEDQALKLIAYMLAAMNGNRPDGA